MNLKPINNNDTITFINTSTFTKTDLTSKRIVEDPKKAIPNGIYGVIRWEGVRQMVTMILSAILLIIASVIITLGALFWNFGPMMYILPSILALLSLYKMLMSFTEFISMQKSIVRYRQDIQVGLTSTPPFISKLYINLHKKQITHNWITFSSLFYLGIMTVILWWLKDVDWWIFHFKTWIHNGMGKPTMVATIMAFSLLAIAIIHIVFAIQRKRRINDMNMYFGEELAPQSQIEEIKAIRNKAYRRMFVISLLVLLLIPVVTLIIMKIIRRKR